MSFSTKTYTLKNKQSISIRPAVSDDAEMLLKLKISYLKETETLPLFATEYPNDIDQEKNLIETYQTEKNSILLVAVANGAIIGNIDLTGSRRKKIQHTAMIGMGIHKNWQNQGIGSLLLQAVIDWATKNQLLKIIWLEVYATNDLGLGLYKKMKFEQAGKIPNFFLEKDGYIDKISMFREVDTTENP